METVAPLSSVLSRYAPFPPEFLESIERSAQVVTIPRDGAFVREGDGPGKVAFVRRGLFRVFYNEEGGESTRAFLAEGTFLVARSGFLRPQGPPFTIEALEDSELAVFPETVFQIPTSDHALLWYQFLLGLTQERLEAKDRRIRGLISRDSASRYREFLAEFPGLEGRIRQHHLASYLGITPVTLSRIRAKLGFAKERP